MVCKIGIDGRAEWRGILRQNAVAAHQRPSGTAVKQSTLDAFSCRLR